MPQQQLQPQVPDGPLALEITIRKAENLPPLKGAKKDGFPVAVCEIKGKPSCRIQTPMCVNMNRTNPKWGRDPDYFRAVLEGWVQGDALTFMVQDEDGATATVVGMKDLTFEEYQNGYEWWLPLEVAKMKQYPEGWPYAAVQVKVQLVHPIRLTEEDPFMSRQNLAPLQKQGPLDNWCFPFRLWCCRRLKVCGLATCINSKWCCLMSCLCCGVGWLECGKICGMTWSWMSGKASLKELRQDCAKRFRLPDGEDDMEDQETACCCVPLRLAIFLISVMSTLVAIFAVMYPGQGASAGYDVKSRMVVGVTQLTGLFFGPIGILGAYQLDVNLLYAYNYYQLARLAGMFYSFYTDITLLSDCNLWKTNINGAIAQYGWNPQMYNVAMANSCLQTTINFALTCVFTVMVYVYLVSLTRKLIWECEQAPKYLLAMPKDTPNGSFIKYNVTQGRSKPPYGSLLGKQAPAGQQGILQTNQQQPGYGAVGANPDADMQQHQENLGSVWSQHHGAKSVANPNANFSY